MPGDSGERILSVAEALREATDICMGEDSRVLVMGLGVTDPKGIFGTTAGLCEKYGSSRVLETPTAENGTAGIAIGAAISGYRPIITHQRVEFGLLAIDPIVTQAAKWHYMTAGKQKVPMVVRLVVGRGWGQGPQHSQSLESWFAHIPGLKVVTPSTAFDAKGLLIAAVRDDNPVVMIESRWTHSVEGLVPKESYEIPIGLAEIARYGTDISIITYSFSVIEALQASEHLSRLGIEAEVLNLRTLRPLDRTALIDSARRTSRVLCVDLGWSEYGISAEVISTIAMAGVKLLAPPSRVGVAPSPIPSTRALANASYPGVRGIVGAALTMMGYHDQSILDSIPSVEDVPHSSFSGPF